MAWFRAARQRCAQRSDNRRKRRPSSSFCFEPLEERLVLDANPLGDFGNDITSAHQIELSPLLRVLQSGDIQTPDDVDYFAFTANFTGQLTVTQRAASGSTLEAHVQAFPASPEGSPAIELAADVVQLQVIEGEIYYVVAGAANGSAGAYELLLEPETPGRLFAIATDSPNSIVELNPETGEEITRLNPPIVLDGGLEGLAYDGNVLFVTTGNGQLWRLDLPTDRSWMVTAFPTGTREWRSWATLSFLSTLPTAISAFSIRIAIWSSEPSTLTR